MKCPKCGDTNTSLITPDYGRGAEFKCYNRVHGQPDGYRFTTGSADGKWPAYPIREVTNEERRVGQAASDAAKGSSRTNADALVKVAGRRQQA